MNFTEIKELMKEFDSSAMSQLEITDGEFSIKMKKGVEVVSAPMQIAPPAMNFANQPSPTMEGATQKEEEVSLGTPIKAPLVGVFYESSAPGAEPYAKVGQKVNKGDVVCLIEAMKMINEVKSPVSGTVKRILAQNEELVSFDQVIMEIEE